MNIYPSRFSRLRIEEINSAELFIDKRVRTATDGFQVQSGVFDNLLYALRLRVIGKKRFRTVTVGEEIDRVAYPNGLIIVGVFARNFFELQIIEAHDVDWRGLSAAVTLPGGLPLQDRLVAKACRV